MKQRTNVLPALPRKWLAVCTSIAIAVPASAAAFMPQANGGAALSLLDPPIAEVFFGGGPQGGPGGRDGSKGFSGGYGDGPKGSPGYGDGPKGPKDGKPEGPKGPKGGWEKSEGPKGPKGGWEKPDGPKGPKGPKGPPRGWDPKEGYCPPRHDEKPKPEPEPISRRDVSIDNACSGEGRDKSQYWQCELLRR